MCIPLNCLLSKDKKKRFADGDWTPECREAFEKLKHALTTAPVLAYPDMNKPFVLSTDASGHAIGYVPGQLDASGKELMAVERSVRTKGNGQSLSWNA